MSTIIQDIEKSRNGDVITIPFKHKVLSKYIYLGRSMYHLIGGAGGSGKSSFIDDNYVISVYSWVKQFGQLEDISLKIILRSLERNKKYRLAKWVCRKLFIESGILIDVPTLLGWGVRKSKVTDEIFEKVKKAYNDVEEMEDMVTVIDGLSNPTGIFLQMRDYCESVGTVYFYDKGVMMKRRNKKKERAHISECPSATPYRSTYVPDNDRHVVLGIIDHLQAMAKESGNNDKENLDKMSEYTRILRDTYFVSPVIVNQLNRGLSDTMRKVKTELEPQDSDFSGTSNLYSDCDMAAILFNPYKYNLQEFKGYQVKSCIDNFGINRFRTLHLLKNTYGPDNQIFPFQFVGENGIFKELPSPELLNPAFYHEIANPPHKIKLTNFV